MSSHRNFMRKFSSILTIPASLLIVTALAGCSSLGDLGNRLMSGDVSADQVASVQKSVTAVQKSTEDITPEQEYYIGRAVGAVILRQYKPYSDPAADHYINMIGQALSLVSDRPELFLGYRFLILDSSDINALSTPSGLVFITRGMLELTRNEADVAAILAHEIGHIEDRDAINAIKTSRITSALTNVAITSAQFATSQDIAKLTSVFSDSINDITQKLVNSGYSRGAESKADLAAVTILERAGYDPRALIEVLQNMKLKLKPGGLDFAKTHPAPEDRIKDVTKDIGNYSAPGYNQSFTQQRYAEAMKGI